DRVRLALAPLVWLLDALAESRHEGRSVLPTARVELGGVVKRIADRRQLLESGAGLDRDPVQERERTELDDASRRLVMKLTRELRDADVTLAESHLEGAHGHDDAFDERPAEVDARRAEQPFGDVEGDRVAGVVHAIAEDATAFDGRRRTDASFVGCRHRAHDN